MGGGITQAHFPTTYVRVLAYPTPRLCSTTGKGVDTLLPLYGHLGYENNWADFTRHDGGVGMWRVLLYQEVARTRPLRPG